MIDRALGILVAIVSLGALAVVLSKRSDTANVVGAVAKGVNSLFSTAVSPVTTK